jgi:hypothetical protein
MGLLEFELTNPGQATIHLDFLHLDIFVGNTTIGRIRETGGLPSIPPGQKHVLRVQVRTPIAYTALQLLLSFLSNPNLPKEASIRGFVRANRITVPLGEFGNRPVFDARFFYPGKEDVAERAIVVLRPFANLSHLKLQGPIEPRANDQYLPGYFFIVNAAEHIA